MTSPFDPAALTMTEIIRLQTLLSQELTRRFERNAALAFTDIVESTRYFAQFGDEAGRRLQQLHLDLLEQNLVQHQGRLVGTAGDGAFVCFASASAAATSMAAFLNAMSAANQSRARAHQLSVRVGMHWGPVLTDGEQVTGDSVNLCARIASTAQPGQLRLSGEMFQQLAPQQRVACAVLASVPLKGITRAVELFEMHWRDPLCFPSYLIVRESGERILLPQLDTLCFGRGETQQGASINDVILVLPDPTASKQISRKHFELLSRPGGYVIKTLSTQLTELDGVAMQRDQELPLRPGALLRLARVMTLEFVAPNQAQEKTIDETMMSPGLGSLRAG
ncbi:MAG: adenylate/guanylate cyclase domain-containing protein [Rhodoferax sp.]|nr:adenylate/guanylate cyclase domain-containing protein [Rhodoferax sp.]